jgi:hypothetical protein
VSKLTAGSYTEGMLDAVMNPDLTDLHMKDCEPIFIEAMQATDGYVREQISVNYVHNLQVQMRLPQDPNLQGRYKVLGQVNHVDNLCPVEPRLINLPGSGGFPRNLRNSAWQIVQRHGCHSSNYQREGHPKGRRAEGTQRFISLFRGPLIVDINTALHKAIQDLEGAICQR